ncbi:abortive infection family protein [Alkalibacterium pelagium]|uniref:Abortive infection C-terminus n=1 Tax=Alkalibacterium pelagium TaxID=426702 RepID=A0A1H7NGW8_9LACT|nr:abortive infection family protein [Alkalibacterium pelagium]GEN51324.1 hypothetical protein APE02nite_19890 [Alkalibacterium pelagium]SEL22569.1 Abortive infection C-terminus [Alkalibacterium pelagium]
MAEITIETKMKLEQLFGMDSGYVMDLSGSQFEDFIYDKTGINIFDKKYKFRSGSKANRLRAFWNLESNQNVSKLNLSLLAYWEQKFRLSDPDEETFYSFYRLKEESVKELNILSKQPNKKFDVSTIKNLQVEENFQLLKNDIQRTLNENQPQLALDRTHTLLMTYLRELCETHGIPYGNKEPLDNLFSKYTNYYNQTKPFESSMTTKIMKIAAQALEKFNNVRNKESFAHSNNVISYDESKLIIDFVFLVLKFIVELESKHEEDTETNEFPF